MTGAARGAIAPAVARIGRWEVRNSKLQRSAKFGRKEVGSVAGVVIVAALAAGCLSLQPPDPARTARDPQSLGIRMESGGGGLRLDPVNVVIRREASTLPFHARPFEEAAPIVRVRVNGRTLLALVDTGSTATIVDAAGAARLGVPALRAAASTHGVGGLIPIPSQGLGAQFRAWLGVASCLSAGGVTVTNMVVGILDPKTGFGAQGWTAGHRVEMLLGSDFLRLCGRVVWDAPGERIALGGSASAGDPEGVALDPRNVVPVCTVGVGADRTIQAGIDSGGSFGLWVPGPLSRGARLPQPDPDAASLVHQGVGGPVLSTPAGPVDVRIGTTILAGVPMVVGATGQGHAHLPHALLGRTALSRRIVTFDFDRNTVHVSP